MKTSNIPSNCFIVSFSPNTKYPTAHTDSPVAAFQTTLAMPIGASFSTNRYAIATTTYPIIPSTSISVLRFFGERLASSDVCANVSAMTTTASAIIPRCESDNIYTSVR